MSFSYATFGPYSKPKSNSLLSFVWTLIAATSRIHSKHKSLEKHVFYGLFWYLGLNLNSCAKNIAKISCQNYRSFTTSLRSKFSLLNRIAEFMIELNIFLIFNLLQDMFVFAFFAMFLTRTVSSVWTFVKSIIGLKKT